MSDFAAQWMFGDQQAASADLMSMSEAAKLPETATKEQKIARFLARGGLERSRGARIVEGAGTGTPIPSEELGVPDPGPKKLARAPLPDTSPPAPARAPQALRSPPAG